MINELIQRREKLQGYLVALDTVIAFETDINALRLDTAPAKPVAEAAAQADVDRVVDKAMHKPARRRSAKAAKSVVVRGGEKSPRALIVNAISHLQEPFTMAHVRSWVMVDQPEAGKRIGKSTWGTTLYALREMGWITELGEKVDGRQAYKRGRHWPSGGALKSAKEQAYQDFRSTVPVPAQVEA